MRKNRNLLALMAGLLSMLFMTSCAAVVAGGAGAAAAYTYLSGWLDRDYSTSLDNAYKASIEALKESHLNVVEQKKDVASASIKAESGDQTYWVKLESKGKKVTNVAVRAGVMGNEEASKKIHREIEGNL